LEKGKSPRPRLAGDKATVKDQRERAQDKMERYIPFLISFFSFFYTSDTNINNSKIKVKRDINRLDQNSIRYKIRIEFNLAATLEFRGIFTSYLYPRI
jgi:hypothetical protein